MQRIQVQFTDEQIEHLRRAASARNVSIAQLVRESVDAQLIVPGQAERQRALEHIGGFHSGRGDVARGHDDYLAEDFA